MDGPRFRYSVPSEFIINHDRGRFRVTHVYERTCYFYEEKRTRCNLFIIIATIYCSRRIFFFPFARPACFFNVVNASDSHRSFSRESADVRSPEQSNALPKIEPINRNLQDQF